jgi:hypothetical protein
MRLMRPWREGGAFDTALDGAHARHGVPREHSPHPLGVLDLVMFVVGAVLAVVSLRPDVYHRLFRP